MGDGQYEPAEQRRRDRLALLHKIQMLRPIGEPFNDALFLCATALMGGEAGKRALAKIDSRLHAQDALVKALQTTVVVRAAAMGFGAMAFEDAALAIGEEFGKLRDAFLLQLDTIML